MKNNVRHENAVTIWKTNSSWERIKRFTARDELSLARSQRPSRLVCSRLINLQRASPIAVAISLPSCPTPLTALFWSFQSPLGAQHNRSQENNALRCPFDSNLRPNSKRENRIHTCRFCKPGGELPGETLLPWKDGTWNKNKTKLNKKKQRARATHAGGLAHSHGHGGVSAHVPSPVTNSATPARRTLKANCQTLARPEGLMANSAVAPTLKWLTKG